MHRIRVIGKVISICVPITFLAYFLSGCAFTSSPSQKTAPSSSKSANLVTWQTYTDKSAIEFSANCQADYNSALQQYKALEQGSFPAAQLLDLINALDITLDRAVSQGSLKGNVHPVEEVRNAAEECEKNIISLNSQIILSRPIYNQLASVDINALSELDQRYVTSMLKDFERSGVNKSEASRKRIAELNDEITELGQVFDKNIRDDVRTVMATVDQLAGLPQDFIDAHQPDENGLVTLTTTYPDYLPVIQYAHDDALKLEMFKAFRQRAYPTNKPILKQLLEKRHEYAQLVGFNTYADYITEDKMIGSAQNAADFIEKINSAAKQRSQTDYQQLLSRLQKIDPSATSVGDWQKTYIENLVKTEVYKVDSQKVREYFSYGNVRAGIFELVETLFNVEIQPWQTDVWHPSVETYQIMDGTELIGQFYLDMHPREGKYNHAAAFGVREGVKGIQTPIAALVCNFPGEGDPSALMEHSQVETFLHEFGHLLHGLFGGHQPRLSLSGINTEWDFVEAPSQMLEEWVWDANTLKTFARNAKGETIPDALIEKMRAGREFGRGWMARYQMYYASLSLNFYNRSPDDLDMDELMQSLQAIYAPFEYVEDTHFYASFGHLYGYSAIYYTYMWSLVIAADMFSEFEKHGIRNPEVAERYRKYVLEPGGTKPAAELVADFLGRPYSFDAFAKQLTGE